MAQKNYLILDGNSKAVNDIIIEVPDGGQLIEYDGPFWPDAQWDGTKLIDPTPPKPPKPPNP